MRRGKRLYVLHELLHFVHDGRFLNQLWVEVYEVVVYVSEMIDQNGYISGFLLGCLHHSQLPTLLANWDVPYCKPSLIFFFINQTV